MAKYNEPSPSQVVFTHTSLIIGCLIALFPFLRVITISLRPANNLFSTELDLIPTHATLQNYINLFTEQRFVQWVFNSVVITVTTAFLGVLLAATAAYAFSRFRFPGRQGGLIFLLLTQMVPGTMLILPQFLILSALHLLDTYTGAVLAFSVSTLPFSVWVLKGYFDTIPRSLEEAAFVDGCSPIGAFFRITLPLSRPALAIVFLFNFTSAWNEYLVASIILGKEDLLVWTIGLQRLQSGFNAQWGMFAAGAVLISIPSLILFWYSSKYMASGLTLGSVKG